MMRIAALHAVTGQCFTTCACQARRYRTPAFGFKNLRKARDEVRRGRNRVRRKAGHVRLLFRQIESVCITAAHVCMELVMGLVLEMVLALVSFASGFPEGYFGDCIT